MEAEKGPSRRSVLAGGLAAAVAGVGGTSSEAGPIDSASKSEVLQAPEHPAFAVLEKFVDSLNRFFAGRPDVMPDKLSEQDRRALEQGIGAFLSAHGRASGLVDGEPRPLGFDAWSLGKAALYSLRRGGDPRTTLFLEIEFGNASAMISGIPQEGFMPPWDRRA